jgi:DNA transformation protein and related proteins
MASGCSSGYCRGMPSPLAKPVTKPLTKPLTTPAPPFVTHCLELLGALGHTRSTRMFGGWGLYVDDLFVALILNEQLYLKANASTQAQFVAAGGAAFVFQKNGQAISTHFFTVPAEAMDSAALMLPWARLAQQAALSAALAKPARRVKTTKPAAKKTNRAKRV